MVTYTDLEKEQLVELNKHNQRRANTLGVNGKLEEEPFNHTEIVFRDDICNEMPEATNFSTPSYRDSTDPLGEGITATRYVKVRLHSLVTSGQNGNTNIQTFMTVSEAPDSDSAEDIDLVRIKRLIPSDKSLGRSHADETDVSLRGWPNSGHSRSERSLWCW
jgi:hypothetical protein